MRPTDSRTTTMAPGVLGCLLLLGAFAGCSDGDDVARADRQAEVAAVGAEVMPFDLDATTHVFTDTPTGGIQDVVADDSSDVANVELIRAHLEDEAARFRVGDFSDPERIHGADMPGLSTLEARFAEIEVELTEIDDGARISYRATDPALVTAIHDWFAAQTLDHGDHAEHGSH